MAGQDPIVTGDWNLYDTRHVVYRPVGVSAEELERGYDWSYEAFYDRGGCVSAPFDEAHATAA